MKKEAPEAASLCLTQYTVAPLPVGKYSFNKI